MRFPRCEAVADVFIADPAKPYVPRYVAQSRRGWLVGCSITRKS